MNNVFLFIIIILIIIVINLTYKETFLLKKKIYLFLTGGFDSTFRLCQLLIDKNKIVSPIYIKCKLDNCKNCSFQRKNVNTELKTIKKIIKNIKKKYPKKSKNLLKLKIIKDIPKNKYITNTFYKLKLHNFNRLYNQYEAMCRLSTKMKKRIEICTVGIYGNGDGLLPTDNWGIYLRDNLINVNGRYRVTNYLDPIYYLDFPLVFLSKKDMLEISKENGYYNILQLTWSCWFPKQGKPCGQCNMCLERIIPHPSLNQQSIS